MVLCMAGPPFETVYCPSQLHNEAMALVLRDVRADHRHEVVHGDSVVGAANAGREEAGLFVALRGGKLCAAAWGQRQPGNTAVFWPAQFVAGYDADLAAQLTKAVAKSLDTAGVGLTQVLLPARDAEVEASLQLAGFRYLTNLSYLSCEAAEFPQAAPELRGLELAVFDQSQQERLEDLIERTYVGTLDCPQLNDARRMDDVVDGYRATGAFRAENWLFARAANRDVGVLLVANHPKVRQGELIYMGLVPEARGRGWGSVLARHALWMARSATVERMILAVDVANRPALTIYRECGFLSWDRRSIFVRIGEKTSA
jgi:mycothiol synthase